MVREVPVAEPVLDYAARLVMATHPDQPNSPAFGEADTCATGPARAIQALVLEAFSIAVFAATDVFLFYVVFEATLIPAYFLIGGSAARAVAAAVKFLVYQLARRAGDARLGDRALRRVRRRAAARRTCCSDLQQHDIAPTPAAGCSLGFFVAFAIKAPLFPVHTWLPDTTAQATTGTSVLLVCVLDKIGTYGMLRFCLGLFPEAALGYAGGRRARADSASSTAR